MQRAQQQEAAPSVPHPDQDDDPTGGARPSPPAAGRRLPERLGWVLAVLVGLLVGVALFLPHRSQWVGHNGDHYYYASTALQYAGMGYDRSLQVATEYFRYPFRAVQLDFGYLDPAVAPLIYPRVVLGLVALPAIHLFGVSGIWMPGMLFGSCTVAALMALGGRQLGRPGVVLLPALVGVSAYATEFMFGIYLEAPVILATAAMLLSFPLGTSRRTWWHAVAAAGLVPVMMLSRQVPLLPVGMAVGGWLWAWAGTRRMRNRWTPFALTVVPVTAISYGVLARWAPYDVLPFLFAKTGTNSLGALIRALPAMWRQTLGADASHLLATDRPIVVVTALALVGTGLAIRNPIAGVCLGSLASGVATEMLNGQPNDFRYLSPSLPPMLLLAALALVWLGRLCLHRVLRLIGMRGRAWPGAVLLRPEPAAQLTASTSGSVTGSEPVDKPASVWRTRPALIAAGVWLAVGALVAGTVAVHRPAPISGAPRVQLDAATYRGVWPFTVQRGTLICAGQDYELWFVTPDGVRYALSGTAMADSLWAPRALDLAPSRITYGWPEIDHMLSLGMQLCGSGRGFQAAPG